MAIPTQTEMFKFALDCIEHNEEFSRKDLCEKIACSLNLSDDEKLERTNSGIELYKSRVNWAVSYLHRAGLILKVKKGVYKLSDEGLKYQGLDITAQEFFKNLRNIIARDNPWHQENNSLSEHQLDNDEQVSVSPSEEMDRIISEINDTLVSEIIDIVLQMDPVWFENLVVELIVRMGYGKGIPTQPTRDCGIDGIVTCDELGFNPVLTQAKFYKPKNKVSRPEIQKFAGALNKYSRGVFVTTSAFTKDAIDFANNFHNADIKLINGEELAKLMIKYNLGVTCVKTYELKRLDSDYFEQ